VAAHLAAAHPGDGMKRAAESAPIWVIAIAGHVLLAAVLGMVYVRQDPIGPGAGPRTMIIPAERPAPKLDDDTTVIEIRREALPRVREADVSDIRLKDFARPDDASPPGLPDAAVDERGSGGEAPGPEGAEMGGVLGYGPGTSSRGRLGPWGSGTGVGGIGQRLVRRDQSAEFPKVEPVVKGGLRWLAEHQGEDGSWSSAGFHLRCNPKHGPECGGRGSPEYDTGVTGLALLAFFGAGHDGRGASQHDDVVRKGLKWLRANQDAEGCFGPRTDRFTYSHACATIAMCEAATFNRSAAWRKSAQQAIRFIERCQTPYKGWRYGLQPGDSDASVTGWMLLALKAGKEAGLEVDRRMVRDGLAFLDAITDESTGRTGYQRRGDLPVRPPAVVHDWPAHRTESLTAVAMCARIFCGEADSPFMKEAQTLLSNKEPAWDVPGGAIDMYYWYYGTLAMHQLGGPAWDRWNKSLEKAVIQSQVKEGCAEGSWDPKDPWGGDGGRVYSTALMTMCFEVYWRYPRVFGTRK
jgi:hypothetical protein